MAENRVVDLSIVVPGAPEEVWRAVATGPGISSWFVPHQVDERAGGLVRMDFGGGFADAATVTAWEPPRRVVLEAGGGRGPAFEWLVAARDGGTCDVRLVVTGFGPGDDGDAEYRGMSEGWPLFLENLRLHLTHFRGRTARAVIPTTTVAGTPDGVFAAACAALGLPDDLRPGDRVAASAPDAPPLAGEVASVRATAAVRAAHLVLDTPTPGTALLAAERAGDGVGLSLWLYLYGDGAAGLSDEWTPFVAALGARLSPAG